MFFFVQMLLHNINLAARMLIASLIALMLMSISRQRCKVAHDYCTDVLCTINAQMLLSIILGIDVVMPSEYILLLA